MRWKGIGSQKQTNNYKKNRQKKKKLPKIIEKIQNAQKIRGAEKIDQNSLKKIEKSDGNLPSTAARRGRVFLLRKNNEKKSVRRNKICHLHIFFNSPVWLMQSSTCLFNLFIWHLSLSISDASHCCQYMPADVDNTHETKANGSFLTFFFFSPQLKPASGSVCVCWCNKILRRPVVNHRLHYHWARETMAFHNIYKVWKYPAHTVCIKWRWGCSLSI